MIQVQTNLKIIDNSGAKIAQCIRPLGGFNRTYAYNGDVIVVSIKQLRLIRKIKKSEVYFALVGTY
jgi:large subunit ribosomal protein L14